MRSSRIPSLVLAEEARRRMPQAWQFRVATVRGGNPVEVTSASRAKWRWEPLPLKVEGGPVGEVLARFENANGRFSVIRSDGGFSVLPEDLPLRADGC
jgi:hypothetical protein